ncbi:GyrI-like domain-containing protein [Ralstonia pickettii]|nr:GyrI-like domain-containing protein [Ralstonia pickettii]
MNKIDILTKKKMYFTGIHLQCSTLEEYQSEIPKAVNQLRGRTGEVSFKVNEQFTYGVFKVDAKDSEDGYWVCFQVTEANGIPPQGMKSLAVPAGSYAAFRHEGEQKAIHQAYEMLHNQIQAAGIKRQTDGWTIEEYDHQYKQDENIIHVVLYDPILKNNHT